MKVVNLSHQTGKYNHDQNTNPPWVEKILYQNLFMTTNYYASSKMGTQKVPLTNSSYAFLATQKVQKFSVWFILCIRVYIEKRFYTRGTSRSIRIPRLAEIPTLYRNWLRSFN